MTTVKITEINSSHVQQEAFRLGATEAELVGTYPHPLYPTSYDWAVTLYDILGNRVFVTNGDAVFEGLQPDMFASLLQEYGIGVSELDAAIVAVDNS
jgi:hypothetical protein